MISLPKINGPTDKQTWVVPEASLRHGRSASHQWIRIEGLGKPSTGKIGTRFV